MKNWNNITFVQIKDAHHGTLDNNTYTSIAEFTNSNEFRIVRETLTDHPNYVGVINGKVWEQSRRYNLIDELGMIIPLWKIREYIPKHIPKHWWYHKNDHKVEYRVDPVPMTGKVRYHHSNYYRDPKTKQEATVNNFPDDDIRDYGIKIRGKRIGYNLPSSWDDVVRSDIKTSANWKSTRKTQYKS